MGTDENQRDRSGHFRCWRISNVLELTEKSWVFKSSVIVTLWGYEGKLIDMRVFRWCRTLSQRRWSLGSDVGCILGPLRGGIFGLLGRSKSCYHG